MPNGLSPHIGANGNWWLGDVDTTIKARGDDGDTGEQGPRGYSVTSITEVESTDKTGYVLTIKRESETGEQTKSFTLKHGITPRIGDDGCWYFGSTSTGIIARGTDGKYITSASVDNGILTLTFNDTSNIKVVGSVKGDTGNDGISIADISLDSTSTDGTYSTYKISYTKDKEPTYFNVYKGDKGDKGDKGTSIKSITPKISTSDSGGKNVIEITLDDNTSKTFDVFNGVAGQPGENGNLIRWNSGHPHIQLAKDNITSKLGDMYIDYATYEVYQCTTEGTPGSYTMQMNIKGAPGDSPVINTPTFNYGTLGVSKTGNASSGYTFHFTIPEPKQGVRGLGIYAGVSAATAGVVTPLAGDLFFNTSTGTLQQYTGVNYNTNAALATLALSSTHIKRSDITYDATTGVLTINNT